MPTYRYNGEGTIHEFDINGHMQALVNGDTLQTYKFLSGANWTETAATPVYNPVLFDTTVTATTGGTSLTLDPVLCKSFTILDISATITEIFIEADTNTPALFKNLSVSLGYVPKYDNSDGKVRKLIVKGSGTCRIVGYRA